VVLICHPSYARSINRRITVEASLGIKKARTYSEITKAKRGGDMA
jgi:hypothetical protein